MAHDSQKYFSDGNLDFQTLHLCSVNYLINQHSLNQLVLYPDWILRELSGSDYGIKSYEAMLTKTHHEIVCSSFSFFSHMELISFIKSSVSFCTCKARIKYQSASLSRSPYRPPLQAAESCHMY